MKNKEEVANYLKNNKDKTLNLNIVLKYHGNSKIPINLTEKKLKKKILFVGQKVPGIENSSYQELASLPRAETIKKIRRKIIVTTPSLILSVSKQILTPLGKARKVKSIKLLKISPTRENIENLSKEKKLTISNKAFTMSLGKDVTTESISKIKEELEDQLKINLKKFKAKYYLFSTFNKSYPILF